ncbi:MAG: YdcF family protein [Novosphingobium sp.]|nr:YdcF family protein [Novosphingobium sp.]
MFRRTASLILLAWALGFLWFAAVLPRPLDGVHSDGVVVPTGGEKRIDRGLTVLRAGLARKLLVSGVDSQVKPQEFADEYQVEPRLMRCCVTLGYESTDTRSNATEAAQWIAANHFRSVRLVTSDWHMRRAAFELAHATPAGVSIIRDAVRSHPTLRTLFLEYHKLLAGWIARLWGA